MSRKYDVAVVGAGIIGLAHAWIAARAGKRVVLFERDQQAVGASIRNFGMIWPIGQLPGKMHEMALCSRSLWCELAEAAGFWMRECGSIHLAHRDDEWNVLQEFAEQAPALGYDCELLAPGEVLAKSKAANRDQLLGGLWSPTEMCVDPREVVRVVPEFLQESCGVEFSFGTCVQRIENGELTNALGETVIAEQIIVASGSDFETLYPDTFASSGLKRCKLQMMRTRPQSNEWELGPHLASGLTLRHYENFAICPGLAALKQRIAEETPELDRFGIHVMAAQNGRGEIILGDSHEYGGDVAPFDKSEIDELMLRELRKVVCLPDWTIDQRWHGVYSKHSSLPYFRTNPEDGVTIVTGLGGAGMTLSFGLAQHVAGEFE